MFHGPRCKEILQRIQRGQDTQMILGLENKLPQVRLKGAQRMQLIKEKCHAVA